MSNISLTVIKIEIYLKNMDTVKIKNYFKEKL